MANIKKNFNFRNGVQVDDDNLLVTSTGLVGIGTTMPTEALDVRGNVNISGVTSISNAIVGVLTATEASPDRIIGAGVSIVSGIVTASGTGIITFFGDASNLLGMPTSQWEDVNIPGFGFTSIYNTGGNVGIATTDPRMTLQVGPDPRVSGQKGVGISSVGDIKASGIITASTFSGNLIGNVTGDVTGTISGNISSGLGTITQINATNINVSGLSTFAGITSVTGPVFHSKQQIISGMSTFSGGVSINNLHIGHNGNGVVGGGATINTSGGDLNLSCGGPSGADPGDEIVCHEDVRILGGLNATGTVQAQQLSATTTLSATSITATNGTFGSSGFLSAQAGLSAKNLRLATTGTDSTITSVSTPLIIGPSPGGQDLNLKGPTLIDGTNPKLNVLGNITINNTSSKVGVGTISPVSDIQVRRYTGDAEIQVTAEAGASRVSLGVESGTGQTDHAELRYNLLGLNQFDGNESFSIVNFGRGNFNYMMSAANSNAATGNFFWMKGNGLSGTLMTLTPTGRLGIGITTPTTPLHVLGAATVSGSLTVGNNLIISGTLNANLSGNVSGNLTGNVNGNANAAAGISTFNNLSVAGIATITSVRSNSIGIGLEPSLPLAINSTANRFFVNANGNVGIKTTSTDGNTLLVAGSIVGQIIGAGTTIPLSTVDFSLAGQGLTGSYANKMFMIPPKVSGTGTLAGVVSGALVYNTSTNTIQVYNGSSWGSLGSGGGGGEANQNAFSNVAVSGQSTVAADSTTDTLTLVAGSNVTITTNAGNDSVTIAASGGGGGGISNVVEDTSPQLGGALDVQAQEINTSTSNGNIKLAPNGSGVVEVRGAGGNDGTLQLNCSAQSHGIKLKSPPHSAGASYTLTFPNSIVNGQFLKTDASGNLSWDSRLGAGFVNAADYGLDASATDGTNVTAINNAISALGTNGGTIIFPGGMFYLNAAIELTQAANENSIRFVGSGHQNYGGGSDTGGTVLRRDADDEFFNITNSRAIHFIGITFKGGAANEDGGNSGISGGNGAIYVLANAGCQGYLIENCVFHGIANCIHFKGLSDSIIRGCRFRNVPSNEGNGACIKLDENGSEVIDQIRIQDCVIDGSPDGSAINTAIDGIAIYNTVSTVYVTNTSAIRLRRSFYSDTNWDGNFFYFQNSEAERANEDGFSINGTGNFVTIDNCFSCTNGQGNVSGTGYGINIGASQNSSINITNPNVRDNSLHGILINGPTNNCSIVNPSIGGNSKGSSGTSHGIVIGTNANNVYITGGKIGGNTDELAGTGTQGYGIQIDGSTHSNIRIIGTNVTGNATNSSEGISQNISSGTGNSIQFNAGSTVAIDT